MKKVLIYGDSNVWGDNFFTGVRIPDDEQWANILQKSLSDYKILQEGLPGRIAGDYELEKTYKNGQRTFIATFRSSAPIDVLIIALGTNDLQIKYQRSASEIVNDLLWYKKHVESEYQEKENRCKYFRKGMPRIIFILPPNFDYNRKDNPVFDEKSEEKRKEIQKIFGTLEEEYLIFDNVSLFQDGIHLNPEGHKMVADIVKDKIN